MGGIPMIHVIASIQVKNSCLNEFLEILRSNIPNVLAEEGCVEYIPALDFRTDLPTQELDASRVTIIEKWDSFKHLKTHLSAPHMLDYRAKTKELVQSVSLKVLELA
jgi:quinol monooxygenase YgiN